ncbi:MAG: hypothetical protein ACRD9W_17310, partial [Terriglobia bacterium]
CNVTIQVADGTYTGAATVSAPWVGSGTVTLQGNTTTPGNCILSTSGTAITVGAGAGANIEGSRLLIGGFKITSSGSSCIQVGVACLVNVTGAMEYGSAAAAHIAVFQGGTFIVSANYTISGSAPQHLSSATTSSIIYNGRTVTLTGSPVFASGFASAARMGQIISSGCTFSGSTGSSSKRYAVATLSLIDTSGAGASYFPGDTAGTTDGTGVYN